MRRRWSAPPLGEIRSRTERAFTFVRIGASCVGAVLFGGVQLSALGCGITSSDGTEPGACMVNDIAAKLEQGGYTVLDLVVDLTQADSFRLRTVGD